MATINAGGHDYNLAALTVEDRESLAECHHAEHVEALFSGAPQNSRLILFGNVVLNLREGLPLPAFDPRDRSTAEATEAVARVALDSVRLSLARGNPSCSTEQIRQAIATVAPPELGTAMEAVAALTSEIIRREQAASLKFGRYCDSLHAVMGTGRFRE